MLDRSIIFVKKKPAEKIEIPTIEEKKLCDIENKIVHIVASGNSARGLGKDFFESIRRDDTIFIAVNHAYKVCNPDYIFFIDKSFVFDEDNGEVLLHKAKKYCFDSKIEGCEFLLPKKENIHTDNIEKYYRGTNSGCAALSFAVKRKPRHIFLWGFDGGRIDESKTLHSTSGVFKHRFDDEKFEKNLRNGIKYFSCIPTNNITNISPKSNIPYFDRITLKEFESIYKKMEVIK